MCRNLCTKAGDGAGIKPPSVLTEERVAEINERIRQGGFAARLSSLFGDDSRRTTEVSYDPIHEQIAAVFQTLLENLSGIGNVHYISGSYGSSKSYGGFIPLHNTTHVSIRRAKPRFINTNVEVWQMDPGGAPRTRAFFFPDALLLFRRRRYEVIPYENIVISGGAVRCAGHSHHGLAEHVGHTWTHTNLDGGPDRRYSQNALEPVALYHMVTLASASELHLPLLIPHEEAAGTIREAFREVFAVAGSYGDASRGAGRDPTGEPTGGPIGGEEETREDRGGGRRYTGASERPSVGAAREVLGVSPDASKSEILSAYRKMSRMYHPDRVEGLGPEFKELAERRMKEINAAYRELKNSTDG